jgi:hypothetical protein
MGSLGRLGIRAGILFGEDRDKLIQLVSSLITKLDETLPISGPDLHTLAVSYIDEVSHYTRVQQLDNTFWGRTSSYRVKGGPYIRKNKRTEIGLENTAAIKEQPVSTDSFLNGLIR